MRRKLPHNLDAEASVLGAVFLRPAALTGIGLEVEDFYDPRHREVFAAMKTLEARSRAIDPVTVEEQLAQAGKLQAVGGLSFLSDLTQAVPTADNITHYVEIVREYSQRRALILALDETLSTAFDLDKTVDEIKMALSTRTTQIGTTSAAAGWVVPMSELAESDSVSYVIDGLIASGVPSILAGPPKARKTMAAMDMAISVVTGKPWLGRFPVQKGPVLLILLEDSPSEIKERLNGLCKARSITPNLDGLYVSTGPFRFDSVEDIARLSSELQSIKPVLVIIDSLSRTHSVDENSKSEMGVVTMAWSRLCNEYGCAMTVLHHFNKGQSEAGPGIRLRGTGDLYALARTVVGIEPKGEEMSKVSVVGNMRDLADSFCFEMQSEPDRIELKFLFDASDRALFVYGKQIADYIRGEPGGVAVSLRRIRSAIKGRYADLGAAVRAMSRLGLIDKGSDGYFISEQQYQKVDALVASVGREIRDAENRVPAGSENRAPASFGH